MIAKKELFVLRRSLKLILVIYAETDKSFIEMSIVIGLEYFLLMLFIFHCKLLAFYYKFVMYNEFIKFELLFNQLAQI